MPGSVGLSSHGPEPIAWDGLGQNPNQPRTPVKMASSGRAWATDDTNRRRSEALVSLRPYSEEWWVVHRAIENDYDAQLANKLVICRGCAVGPASRDVTGSVSGKP